MMVCVRELGPGLPGCHGVFKNFIIPKLYTAKLACTCKESDIRWKKKYNSISEGKVYVRGLNNIRTTSTVTNNLKGAIGNGEGDKRSRLLRVKIKTTMVQLEVTCLHTYITKLYHPLCQLAKK